MKIRNSETSNHKIREGSLVGEIFTVPAVCGGKNQSWRRSPSNPPPTGGEHGGKKNPSRGKKGDINGERPQKALK